MVDRVAPVKHGSWTPAEVDLVEARMGQLVPGYRLCDYDAVTAWLVSCSVEGESRPSQLRRVLNEDPFRKVENEDGSWTSVVDGVPEAWFWLMFHRMLAPFRVPNPLTEIKWWCWVEMGRGRRAAANWWGGQSTMKSSFFGEFAYVQAAVWGRMAIGYVAGPWKNAMDDKVWGSALRDFAQEVEVHNPEVLAELGISVTQTAEYFRMKAGTMGQAEYKAVALAQAATVQGRKANQHGDGRRGITLLIVDEAIENSNIMALKGWRNLRSNVNAYFLTGCNPDPTLVMQPNVKAFCEPIARSPSQMRSARDFAWRTRIGWTFRLAWDNCPNKLLGRTEYVFMLNQGMMDAGESDEADARAGQFLAWGFGEGSSGAITDRARQVAGGVFDTFTWVSREHTVLCLDPAHGGRDPAVVTELASGKVSREVDRGTSRVIAGVRQEEVQVHRDYVADDRFFNDLQRLVDGGFTTSDAAEGIRVYAARMDNLVGSNYKLALDFAVLAFERGVPASHLTFDSSQRADFFGPMTQLIGANNLLWYYEGTRKLSAYPDWEIWPPETRSRSGHVFPILWKDRHSETMTALSIELANLAHSGYVVGGENIERGLDEMGTRPVVKRGARMDLVSKAEMKKSIAAGGLGLPSPAFAETLVMGAHLLIHHMGAINLGEKTELRVSEGGSTAGLPEGIFLGGGRPGIRGEVQRMR
jgi:hypothetical protein